MTQRSNAEREDFGRDFEVVGGGAFLKSSFAYVEENQVDCVGLATEDGTMPPPPTPVGSFCSRATRRTISRASRAENPDAGALTSPRSSKHVHTGIV